MVGNGIRGTTTVTKNGNNTTSVQRQCSRESKKKLRSKWSDLVPDHSTLSRGLRHLEVELGARVTSKRVHIVLDSSGMQVYGEDEWKVRQHGYSYRRTWRKLHIGVNEATCNTPCLWQDKESFSY